MAVQKVTDAVEDANLQVQAVNEAMQALHQIACDLQHVMAQFKINSTIR